MILRRPRLKKGPVVAPKKSVPTGVPTVEGNRLWNMYSQGNLSTPNSTMQGTDKPKRLFPRLRRRRMI